MSISQRFHLNDEVHIRIFNIHISPKGLTVFYSMYQHYPTTRIPTVLFHTDYHLSIVPVRGNPDGMHGKILECRIVA